MMTHREKCAARQRRLARNPFSVECSWYKDHEEPLRFRTFAEAETWAKKVVRQRQGGWARIFNGKTLEDQIDYIPYEARGEK